MYTFFIFYDVFFNFLMHTYVLNCVQENNYTRDRLNGLTIPIMLSVYCGPR